MKFAKVDEDAYEITMNLDTLRRISDAFATHFHEGDADDRDKVLLTSFENAYERFTHTDETETGEVDLSNSEEDSE